MGFLATFFEEFGLGISSALVVPVLPKHYWVFNFEVWKNIKL